MTDQDRTTILQGYIDRMLDGDDSYRQLLVDHTYERLRWHVRKQMPSFAKDRRWQQTDDVLQEASLRLWQSLEAVRPSTVREFFGLASLQIRRTLLDLSRRHKLRWRKHATNLRQGESDRKSREPADPTGDPVLLFQCSEFHEKVAELPEEQRTLFDLLHYSDISQPEAAQMLGMSERTLKRRWREARLALIKSVEGSMPGDA